MRIRNRRWLALGVLMVAGAAASAACTIEESDGSAAGAGGAEPGTGGAATGGVATGGTATGGTATGGAPVTAGAGGAAPVAGGAGGEAPVVGGAGGAASVAGGAGGVPMCWGDTWTAQPDCSLLPGAGAVCPSGGAGGEGGGTGGEPSGPVLCDAFVRDARQGFAEAFHDCVQLLTDPICTPEYEDAVIACSRSRSADNCPTSEAITNCAGITCGTLTSDECLSLFNTYPAAYQTDVKNCYDRISGTWPAGCEDALYACEEDPTR
jgi:hypothetical protein